MMTKIKKNENKNRTPDIPFFAWEANNERVIDSVLSG